MFLVLAILLFGVYLVLSIFLPQPEQHLLFDGKMSTEEFMARIEYAESQRQDEDIDSVITTINEAELYNNPYIKHIRTAFDGYLDESNNGIEYGATDKIILDSGLGCGLDSFDKDYYQSEFSVINTERSKWGGITSYIVFLNNPDRIFWAWTYKYGNGEYGLKMFCEYSSLVESKLT